MTSCSAIRALTEYAPREVCVIDDGLQNFVAHAHLEFPEEIASARPSIQVAVRGNLLDLFQATGTCELDEVDWGN